MAENDRLTGLVGYSGVKVPVLVATTAAITLSGTQTIDGVACVTGDRVLVKNQASAIANGIYAVDTGDWARTKDADGPYDFVFGSLIPVASGTVSGRAVYQLTTTGTILPGTSSLTFTAMGLLSAPVPIAAGGTGQITAAAALAALGGSPLASPSFTGTVTIGEALAATGDISPAQIVANTNDYAPAGFATATILRLNTDASRNLTSIAGGTDGRLIIIVNTGSFPLVLKVDDGATGTAANRFSIDQDIAIQGAEAVVIEYDATTSRWRVISRPSRPAIVGVCSNAAGRTNAGTPNSKVDFTADELLLKDANGATLKATAVNVTSDITVAGANGLDTGAEAGNTWYYHYVIAKPDGTKAGLISASATAPTMPAGYTFRALVSAVRNDAGSNFVRFRQTGNELFYETVINILNAAAAAAETPISLTTLIPPIAQVAYMFAHSLGITTTAGGIGDVTAEFRIISGSGWKVTRNLLQGVAGANGEVAPAHGDCIVPNVSQTMYYLLTATTGVNPTLILDCFGFKLPMGGE